MSHRPADGPEVTRRDFLGLASFGLFALSLVSMGAAGFRFAVPSVFNEPSTRIRLGKPENFPLGSVTRVEAAQAFVFSGDDGIHVISSVCTHLGCIVSHSEEGMRCPCHGSAFDAQGRVTGGPAPRDLPWLEVVQSADGGLYVDSTREVKAGTTYKFTS